MKLHINGVQIDFREKLTITELIQKRDIRSPKMVAVELNRELIPYEKYDKVWLKDNDTLEFLFLNNGDFES